MRVRSSTFSVKDMRRADRRRQPEPDELELRAELEARRPKTRADCAGGPRPCPFVSCRYNLYADVDPRTGSLKLNFPDLELDELPDTCALDVADRGGVTLEETGSRLNLTRERTRQMEAAAMAHVRDLVEPE